MFCATHMGDTRIISTNDAPTPASDRKRKQSPPDGFDKALAALAGRGRVDQPYADDADRRMGDIQRPDSVAGRLARMRRTRPTILGGALPLPPLPLSPLADDQTRLAVDALFGWLDSIVLSDSVAWDAIDLDAAPDNAALTALVIAEWIDDCFCARPSEYRGDAAHASASTHTMVSYASAEVNDPDADSVAAAFWFMEQLEAGASGDDTVRARMGLDDAQGNAACLRLAATSAVKHVAPDYEDVTEIFHDLGLGRTIASIGKLYRSALRARLARLYAVYSNLAEAVDAARRAGFPAPRGHIPTPQSAQSWAATCADGSDAFAALWSSTTSTAIAAARFIPDGSDGEAGDQRTAPPVKRRRQMLPRSAPSCARRRPRGKHQETRDRQQRYY